MNFIQSARSYLIHIKEDYMRDSKRLDSFYDKLKELHKQIPDIRFGQLICNLQRSEGNDLFYYEEDRLLKAIEKHIHERLGEGTGEQQPYQRLDTSEAHRLLPHYLRYRCAIHQPAHLYKEPRRTDLLFRRQNKNALADGWGGSYTRWLEGTGGCHDYRHRQ